MLASIVVFHDADGLHVIGVERPDHALSLMQEYADEHNLPAPEENEEKDLGVSEVRNVRRDNGTVRFDVVDALDDEPSQTMHTWYGFPDPWA